jgi:hypothetical protein
MRSDKANGPRDHSVSAKELAEMGFCEKRIELSHRIGVRQTKEHEARIARGRREHRRYFEEGVAATRSAVNAGDCFIATFVFGRTAWQTNVLRRYPDEVLLSAWWGRQLVRSYASMSPIACLALRRWPVLQRPVHACLHRFVSAMRERDQAGRGQP